jgi:hypothetical protein
MVLGPSRFFLKFIVGQLSRQAQPSSLISPFFPLSKPTQLYFLLDFHYFNALHGVSVPVTVTAYGSLVL